MKKLFDPYLFEQGQTRQGVPVYVKKLPWIKGWFDLRIVFRVGAQHDPAGKEGLAHFLEHMYFEGCTLYPTSHDVWENSYDILLSETLNAHTGLEEIVFKGIAAKDSASQVFHFFHNLIFHPLLRSEDIETERGIITSEIRQGIHNKQLEEHLRGKLFRVYGRSGLRRHIYADGYEGAVGSILREDLLCFHRRHINPANAFVLMVGDVSLANGERLAGTVFSDIPAGLETTPIAAQAALPEPDRGITQYNSKDFGPQQAQSEIASGRIMLHNELVNRSTRSAAISVLQKKLQRVIRQSLGATYSVSFKTSDYSTHSEIQLETHVLPEKTGQCLEQIRTILTEYPDSDEFAQGIANWKKRNIRSLITIAPSCGSIASEAVDDLIVDGRIETVDEIRKRHSQVMPETVRKFVQRELHPDRLFWMIVK